MPRSARGNCWPKRWRRHARKAAAFSTQTERPLRDFIPEMSRSPLSTRLSLRSTATGTDTRPTCIRPFPEPRNAMKPSRPERKVFLSSGTTGMSTRARRTMSKGFPEKNSTSFQMRTRRGIPLSATVRSASYSTSSRRRFRCPPKKPSRRR